jgi:16S rRNA (uracil1498-N3)-methyltransferase
MASLASNHRLFFLDDLNETAEEAVIAGEEYRHIRVLRPRPGHRVALTNGQGLLALCRLESFEKDHCTGVVEQKETIPLYPVRITLVFAPTKRDKWEWLVEKATENGVFSFVPLITKRNREFAGDFSRKSERFGKIMREAVKQSKRAWLPRMMPPLNLDKEIDFFANFDTIALMNPGGREFGDYTWAGHHNVAVVVGPEGGWDEEEAGALRRLGARECALGDYILKTETAALKAAFLIQYLCGGG